MPWSAAKNCDYVYLNVLSHSACTVEAITEVSVISSAGRFRMTSASIRYEISASQRSQLEYFESVQQNFYKSKCRSLGKV